MIDVRNSLLITVDEAASLLRKSRQTVYRYIRSHRLEAVRVGGELRTTKEACQAFIEPAQTAVSQAQSGGLTEWDKRELKRHGINLGNG